MAVPPEREWLNAFLDFNVSAAPRSMSSQPTSTPDESNLRAELLPAEVLPRKLPPLAVFAELIGRSETESQSQLETIGGVHEIPRAKRRAGRDAGGASLIQYA
jgi:hypothetical protein